MVGPPGKERGNGRVRGEGRIVENGRKEMGI